MSLFTYSFLGCTVITAGVACIAIVFAIGGALRNAHLSIEVVIECDLEPVFDILKDPMNLKHYHPYV